MFLNLERLSHNVNNVSRDEALKLLRDFCQAARERRSDFKHILVITGLQGSGKSVLAAEVARVITNLGYYRSRHYNHVTVAQDAINNRLIIIDDFPIDRIYSRISKMLSVALWLARSNSMYVVRGHEKDTSNTYAVITTLEKPKWLDTNTMIHLNLHPWGM